MARTFKHWTPLYIFSRMKWDLDQRLRPDDPWITRQAINLLDQLLRRSDRGVEFGSGRSTRWFAARMANLTSVEHNPAWHGKVSALIAGLSNVDYRLVNVPGKDGDGGAGAYAGVLDGFAHSSLDFVLVDGVYRNHCAKAALPKLKSGGLLVIDNANWFLPCTSRAPNSRTPAQGPVDSLWSEVHAEIRNWRAIWTTNNVSDTAIFIKS